MKTSELADPALDWAVAKCERMTYEFDGGACWVYPAAFDGYVAALRVNRAMSLHNSYKPSTDWAQGGPIIEREGINHGKDDGNQNVAWSGHVSDYDCVPMHYGPTPLIAAMRCYVASKLGDEVDIPEELR